MWYVVNNYDSGDPPASFFADGSQGRLLVTQTYLSRAGQPTAPLPHAKRPPPGGYVLNRIIGRNPLVAKNGALGGRRYIGHDAPHEHRELEAALSFIPLRRATRASPERQ